MLCFLKIIIISSFAMQAEEPEQIQISQQKIIHENLQKIQDDQISLTNLEETASEKADRIKRLSNMRKICCLGCCMSSYNKLMSCMWHMIEPCLETVGVVSLFSTLICNVIIPNTQDTNIKNTLSIVAAVCVVCGPILIKVGSKFAKNMEKRHEENVLALAGNEI